MSAGAPARLGVPHPAWWIWTGPTSRLGSDEGRGAGQTGPRHEPETPAARGIGTARGEYRGRSAGRLRRRTPKPRRGAAARRRPVAGPDRRGDVRRARRRPGRRGRSRRCASTSCGTTTSSRCSSSRSSRTSSTAALLASIGVALNRRLRSAWWLLVIWWVVLPQLGRIDAAARRRLVVERGRAGHHERRCWCSCGGAGNSSRRAPGAGSFWAALAFFLVGGAVILFVGTWLVTRFGQSDDAGLVGLLRLGQHAGLPRQDGPGEPCDRAVLGPGGDQRDRRGRRPRLGVPPVPDAAVHAHARRRRRGPRAHAAARLRRRGLAGLLRHPSRQVRRLGLGGGGRRPGRGSPTGWSARSAWPAATPSATRCAGPRRSRRGGARPGRTAGRSPSWARATAGAVAYTEAGLKAWEIGDEAILDLRAFSLTGPGMKAVRQSVARLQRRGYTTRVERHSGAGRRALRGPRRGGRAVARGRWRRARLLDGARPARRRARRRLRADRGARRGRPAARVPQLRPVGSQRAVAGPDAARPHGRQRPGRAHGGLAGRAGDRVRRRPALAELRDVPGGVRAGRRGGRRADRAPVAVLARAGQPQLAARVALPVERQVPAGVAAAVHLLRVHLGPAADRHGGRQRRGVPHPAEPGAGQPARQGRWGRRARAGRARLRGAGRGADPCGARPGRARARGRPPARAAARPARQGRADARPRDRPLSGDATRAPTPSQRSSPRTRTCPRTPAPATPSRSRRG